MRNYFLIVFIGILLFGCSPANLIVTGTKRKAIAPGEVVIYNAQTTPQNYEIIGRINVQSESTVGRSGAHKRNISKLKTKAASVGANGLILGDTQNSHNAWGDGFMSINAIAIYVSKENASNNNIPKDEINSQSKTEKLRELKKLLDEGILTQEEFDNEKKKILGG